MTSVMIVVATIEMFMMDDPEITSFAKPLSPQDKEEQGAVNFADYGYLLSVATIINDKVSEVPPEVAKLTAYRLA